jgi:hypothetical protein
MKVSNPYGASDTFKVPPETINAEQKQASGKAKARYPNKPMGISTSNSDAGKAKTRAYTPGGPAGS